MGKKSKIGKKLASLIIVSLLFAVISCLHLLGVFNYLEYKSYDFRVRFWANSIYSRPSDEIVLIIIDQDSLDWAQSERGWGWPWPRQAYAEIVEYMNLADAKSVAFDIIFSEPSIYRNAKQDEIIDNMVDSLQMAQAAAGERQRREAGQLFMSIINNLHSLSGREDDASFINASKDFGRVVQAVVFSSQTGVIQSWPDLEKPLFQPENFGSFLEKFNVDTDAKGQFPISGLREFSGALGSVTGVSDSDGIYRRIKPFTMFDGKAVPGLSAASLLVSGKGNQIRYDEKSGFILWEDISIPVDKDGNA
ncbi:MAG: CHASE2 domain-containing protein, partial [Spirochaetes bacterium]|nr:CHASE2 domain-containing protein [Spirochaetota bacterium]